MPMTKPTSEQVTFLAAGSGASQRAESQTLRFNASATSAGATTVYFGATYFVAT